MAEKYSGTLDIGYKGKMFKQPVCKYEIDVNLPEGMNDAHKSLIKQAFDKLFAAEEKKLAKERASAIRKAMEDTEKMVEKNPPSNMSEFLKTAEKLIQQGVDTWSKNLIPAAVDKCLEKVMDAVDKKLNTKLNRKVARAVVRIVVLSLLVLAGAAVGIAVTVLTGGAMAPIVLASIGTGVGALISVATTIKKEYDGYNSTMEKIEKDLKELEAAIKYQEKKKEDLEKREKKSLGPKEFIKLILAGTAPIVKKLETHMAEADAKNILARKSTQEAIDKFDALEIELKKMETANDKEVSKEATALIAQHYAAQKAAKKAKEQLDAYDKVSKDVRAALQKVKDKGEFDGGNLNKAVQFCMAHKDTAVSIINALKVIATGASKLKKLVK